MWTTARAIALGAALLMTSSAAVTAADSPPGVLLLDPDGLIQARADARNGDPAIQPQLAALRVRADAALGHPPASVTEKRVPPPSGDVHDYASLSIYWWPDPASPSGLPYLQRDGVRNPEADDAARYDADSLTRTVGDVEDLALAYYLVGDERYARAAARLLDTWFLDPATRMQPNFSYAQIIPGRDAVRGTGIIESRRFTRIVDSVALLQGCACWSSGQQQALRAWFHDFADWLRSSPNGQMEARTSNNHAVWYDVQLVDFAIFAGDQDRARQVLEQARDGRIGAQIAADGRMPRELERTRSLHYSNFNLQAFAELATLGQKVGVDLWSYQSPSPSPDGTGSIRAALDFLVPYMTASQVWPYEEITDVDPFEENAQTLARAASTYPAGPYSEVLAHLATDQSPLDLLRLTLGYWPD